MERLEKYLNSLDFEYVITYSGLRGEKFEHLEIENKKEIQKLEKEIESARFIQKPKLNKKVKALKTEIDLYESRLIDTNGIKHKSTESIKKIESNDLILNEIFKLLKRKIEGQTFVMCMPIYRDSIVFYNASNSIIGILHICFGCYSIIDENENSFDYDSSVIPELREFFLKFGHEIEKKSKR